MQKKSSLGKNNRSGEHQLNVYRVDEGSADTVRDGARSILGVFLWSLLAAIGGPAVSEMIARMFEEDRR